MEHEPESLRLDHNGRVVIPAALRKALHLKAGDRLVAWAENGRIILRPRAELIRELRARFQLRPGEERATTTLKRMREEETSRARED